jgi:hypothetical protein
VARRAAKVDANHADVVTALRDLGYSVTSTAPVGNGFPDVAVGFRDDRGEPMTVLLEIKASPKHKLNRLEQEWFSAWTGAAYVVTSPKDAVQLIFDLRLTPRG